MCLIDEIDCILSTVDIRHDLQKLIRKLIPTNCQFVVTANGRTDISRPWCEKFMKNLVFIHEYTLDKKI